MATDSTSSATPQVPPSLSEAAYRQGWLMADEAIRHLEKAAILPGREERRKQPASISPEILMELAAVLRLSSWQDGGLCELLKEEAAAAFAALDDSEAKFTADPQAFARQEGLPPLAEQVFGIWERHLAWSGLEELSADVLLDLAPAEEEVVLQELAHLLWNLRHTGPHHPGS